MGWNRGESFPSRQSGRSMNLGTCLSDCTQCRFLSPAPLCLHLCVGPASGEPAGNFGVNTRTLIGRKDPRVMMSSYVNWNLKMDIVLESETFNIFICSLHKTGRCDYYNCMNQDWTVDKVRPG